MPFSKTARRLALLNLGSLGKLPVALKIASAHISPSHASHVHSSPQPAHIVVFQKSVHHRKHKKSSSPTGSEATHGAPFAAAPHRVMYTDK